MSQNKVSTIRLTTTANGKIAFATKIINTVTNFWTINLSSTEQTVLAYFMVYGITNDCKDLIVKANVCKNVANINTLMTKLKHLGLIYKDELNGKNYICKQLKFELTPTVAIFLKLENK